MGGRADKLFIGGMGMGGELAMQAAFYSPENLGGVFSADAEIPANILEDIQNEKAASLIPQYELKQKMFVCVTGYKKTTDELKNKIG